MGIITSFFRFLFWVLVLSWSISLLKRLFRWFLGDLAQPQKGVQEPKPEAKTATSRRLVRDPICGMHVAEELAVATNAGSEVIYFCSVECRDQYQRSTQKMAANG